MKKLWICLWGIALLLTGCGQKQAGLHLVEKIEVQYLMPEKAQHRIYTEPGKMTALLTALRVMEQDSAYHREPLDPYGPGLKLTLSYVDGSQKRYRIQSDRYLCSDCHGWQAVDEEKAQVLTTFIEETPGDPETDPDIPCTSPPGTGIAAPDF